jgi:hypothetical protein
VIGLTKAVAAGFIRKRIRCDAIRPRRRHCEERSDKTIHAAVALWMASLRSQ